MVLSVEQQTMSGLNGTKFEDFISAAKARAEAAMQDKHPRLTRLEKAFRHAALKRQTQQKHS